MVAFNELSVREVLGESYVSEYERRSATFFFLLSRLDDNLYLLRRLTEFPFNLFSVGMPGLPPFFMSFASNAVDANTLILSRIAVDKDPDCYTLDRFKRDIQRWLRPQYVEPFRAFLKRLKMGVRMRALIDGVAETRHKIVAHSHQEFFQPRTYPGLLPELLSNQEALSGELKAQIAALMFNVVPRYGLYGGSQRDPEAFARMYGYQPDIDLVLDAVARQSRLLNLLESDPALWREQRTQLSPQQLVTINEYRRRFGLPPA